MTQSGNRWEHRRLRDERNAARAADHRTSEELGADIVSTTGCALKVVAGAVALLVIAFIVVVVYFNSHPGK